MPSILLLVKVGHPPTKKDYNSGKIISSSSSVYFTSNKNLQHYNIQNTIIQNAIYIEYNKNK